MVKSKTNRSRKVRGVNKKDITRPLGYQNLSYSGRTRFMTRDPFADQTWRDRIVINEPYDEDKIITVPKQKLKKLVESYTRENPYLFNYRHKIPLRQNVAKRDLQSYVNRKYENVLNNSGPYIYSQLENSESTMRNKQSDILDRTIDVVGDYGNKILEYGENKIAQYAPAVIKYGDEKLKYLGGKAIEYGPKAAKYIGEKVVDYGPSVLRGIKGGTYYLGNSLMSLGDTLGRYAAPKAFR